MAGSILFIQQAKNFLMSAICSGLDKGDIKYFTSSYDIKEIGKYIEQVDAIFISLDNDSVALHTDTFVYIKDILQDYTEDLFIMGDPYPVESATAIIGKENITRIFLRPVNAKDVSTILIGSIDNDEKRNRENFKSVLVVDDSGTFLHTIKNWLSPYYNVTVVNSAMMALTYLGKNKTDLILLDYEMPVCSGAHMLEILRADEVFKDIPVMFLTGKGDRESISSVLALRPQGYLLKTLPKEKILESVGNFFANQE